MSICPKLCGICASDLHLLFANADPRFAGAALPGASRLYLGHEVIGEVSEAGHGVTSLKAGGRVVMDSRVMMSPTCLSQELEQICRHCRQGNYQLCENASLGQGPVGVGGGWGDSFTAHETEVYPVPDDLDDETAMMIEPLSVGVRAAMARLPNPDEQALVVGCGIVGLNVVQAMRALSRSCRIVALARYPQQIDMARKLGADEVISSEDPYTATAAMTGAKLYTHRYRLEDWQTAIQTAQDKRTGAIKVAFDYREQTEGIDKFGNCDTITAA